MTAGSCPGKKNVNGDKRKIRPTSLEREMVFLIISVLERHKELSMCLGFAEILFYLGSTRVSSFIAEEITYLK